MEAILYNISQVLGIAIINSLWQGLLIYCLLRIALVFAMELSAAVKYWFAMSTLLAATGWFMFSITSEIDSYTWLVAAPYHLSAPLVNILPDKLSSINTQGARSYYSIEGYLPYVAALYVVGLLFNSTKLVLARKKILAIKNHISIDIALQFKVNQFAQLLNIGSRVRIGLSKLVDVPCVTGYLKPVILLPFTLSAYLSAEEIEAILLHELAHIKRNDYLFNLLQQAIKNILFFNPFIHLINRIINEERENSCDDMVVNTSPQPVVYAKALLKLEQTRENNIKMAMAATGKKYQLLNRIERIMKTKKTTVSVRPALLAMLLLTAITGIMILFKPEAAQGKISVKTHVHITSHLLAVNNHEKALNDTAHRQVHTSAKTHKTGQHSSSHHLTGTVPDLELENLSGEIQKYSQVLTGYYNTEAFKSFQKQLEEKGREMQEYANSPELRRLQEEITRTAGKYSNDYADNGDLTKISVEMGKKGNKIGAYYSTPEFKKLNEALEKKYGIPHDRYDYRDNQSENYKKYEAELNSRIPTDTKQEQDELAKMGKQMSAHYDTPEFKERNRKLQELSDSLSTAYNPQMKIKQMDMEKLAKQMSKYQSDPELKKTQALLNQAIKKMDAYINSPEYKKNIKQAEKMRFNYNFNFNNDQEKPEVPEKPEAPEKLEAPEQPEQ